MRARPKQTLTMCFMAVLALAAWPAAAIAASLNTIVVTDPLTGVALSGYDPVSYFTGTEPQLGRSDYVVQWSGVPWYFSSPANRDVFARAPEVYAPQFGGYSPMALARGFLSDGNPRIFSVYRQRLYLFYSVGTREAFLLSPEKALEDAASRWPALSATLTRD